MNKIGSREDVMSGIAKKTSGGLTKQKLKYNKQQKIVSRKVSNIAKKNNRLGKARYITKNRYDGSQVGGVKQTITFNYISSNYDESSSYDESSEKLGDVTYKSVEFIDTNDKNLMIVYNIIHGIYELHIDKEINAITSFKFFAEGKHYEYLEIDTDNYLVILQKSFLHMDSYKGQSLLDEIYGLKIDGLYKIDKSLSTRLIYETIESKNNREIAGLLKEKLIDFKPHGFTKRNRLPLLYMKNAEQASKTSTLESMLTDPQHGSKFIILYSTGMIKAIAFLIKTIKTSYLATLMAETGYGNKMMNHIKDTYMFTSQNPLQIRPGGTQDNLVQFYSRDWITILDRGYVHYTECLLTYEEPIGTCIKCNVKIEEQHTRKEWGVYPYPKKSPIFSVIIRYDDIKRFIPFYLKSKLSRLYNSDNIKFIAELNTYIKSSQSVLITFIDYFRSKKGDTMSNLRCLPSNKSINLLIYKTTVYNCFMVTIIYDDNTENNIVFRYNDISALLVSQTDSILLKTMIGKRERKQDPRLFIEALNRLLKSDNKFKMDLASILVQLDNSYTDRCK